MNSNSTANAKKHIESIRKSKFFIGEKSRFPISEDLHNAVTNLSCDLYTKDVHFLMELIQNAEDNEYSPGLKPTLEFVLTTKDITGLGASATLLVFNNEVGFSKSNIESLCSIGRSTKKGHRHQGYIGEKGIGFKSVFLVSACPHIFSNGYKIRFSETPNQDCGIGYIVPEWIASNPTISNLRSIYGSGKVLPMTTIVLPLKPEKVEAVKKQLSEIHPEVLLFLYKIKRLSVRENSGNTSSADSISAISISTETNIVSLNSQGADCRVVHLSVQEESDTAEATCPYYIWRQVFPVNTKKMVDARKDIKELVISLAFPSGNRLKRGTSSVGIFAFLPTSMVTNFPFIVQADFILASSRETILLDSKWNLGILDLVPSAFTSAVTSFMKSTSTAEYFSVTLVLAFLPLQKSPYEELNRMRRSIKTMLQEECIVPCETFLKKDTVFCKPPNAVRILPEFRKILLCIKEHSVLSGGSYNLEKYVLQKSGDHEVYEKAFDFLGVAPVGDCNEWYGKCIRACNLMSRASTDEYVDLLCFLADNWKHLPLISVRNIPLLKYITWNGEMMRCSVLRIKREKLKIHLVWDSQEHGWLSKWNLAMGCPDDMFFLSGATVTAIVGHEREHSLKQWLTNNVGVVVTNVSKYCSKVSCFLGTKKDPKPVVSFSHFIYHSCLKSYIRVNAISRILRSMPVVDKCGKVVLCPRTLVPAFRSKWKKLFDSYNPFTEEAYNGTYVELGMVYAEAAEFAGECTPKEKLLDFLTKKKKAFDLLDILPQDVVLPVANTQLTCDQALLFLEWIRSMRTKYGLPMKFIESIRSGKWLKTYSGFNSPTKCFLCDGTEMTTLLEMGKTLKVISAIDEGYYMNRIRSSKDELIFIGVQVGSEDMFQVITDKLKRLASSGMNREFAILLLNFMKYSRKNNKLSEDLLKSVKDGRWLKTNKGFMNPTGIIFLKSGITEEALLQITDLLVVDKTYYGSQFGYYQDELRLLGVLVDLEDVYKLIPEHFRFPVDLYTMTKDSVLLLLGCIQLLGSEAISLMQKLRCQTWMKTRSGFRCPLESVLFDQKWDHLFNVVPLPIIDDTFYGSRIRSYKAQLDAIGVAVDIDGTVKMLSDELMSLSSRNGLNSATVISLLKCVKCMDKTMPVQFFNLVTCFRGEKWLKTCQGIKSAPDSILFDSKWETVLQYVKLPFIDVTYYGAGIYSFKDELKMFGAVVDFSEGAHFVARDLKLPKEPASVTPNSAHSLLHCAASLRNSCNSSDKSLLEPFLEILMGSKWLKTHMGYSFPGESILFNPEWGGHLEQHDGPFLDQTFYGDFSSSEKNELRAIGVKIETEEVCTLMSTILTSHTQTRAITRIYRFLKEFNWSPKSLEKSSSQLWIPDQTVGKGKWVSSNVCVLHCQDNLFFSRLLALDEYYDKDLLPFLSTAFGVADTPSLTDYVKLWNDWEKGMCLVSSTQLNSFWGYISGRWNPYIELTFQMQITMLPASTDSGSAILVKKCEVFIPDDLQLKRAFAEVSGKPLFVWLPPNGSSTSSMKLHEIYESLGVQKISRCVHFDPYQALSFDYNFEKLDLRNNLIGKALIKIILGFLSNVAVEERHKRAKGILELSVFGIDKPIPVSYGLFLPSVKKRLDVEIRKPVLWEKNSRRLLVQSSLWTDGQKSIEFITSFARAISEAVMPENRDLMDRLCKMIQMAVAVNFVEESVDHLLVNENIELFAEDKEFLHRSFLPSMSASVLVKRESSTSESPSTPDANACKRRRGNWNQH